MSTTTIPEPGRVSERPGAGAIATLALLTATRLWRTRRLVFLFILAALPTLIAVIIRHTDDGRGAGVFEAFAPIAFLFLLSPIVNVFQTAGIFADEVDDRTLGYLLVRPIGREYLLAGKVLGAWLTTSLYLASTAVLVHLPYLWTGDLSQPIHGDRLSALGGLCAILSVSSLLYVGYAVLAGILLSRPVLWAIGYMLAVEVAFAIFLNGPPARLAVSHHLARFLPASYTTPEELWEAGGLGVGEVFSPAWTLIGLSLLTCGIYAAAVVAVRRSEFPLKDE
jgi:ABC-type transport system involved in multi-copper enzyme maturation permease subunit